MKKYNEFSEVYIGSSDIADLTVRTPTEAYTLHFGKDGSYSAYYIEGEAEIGEHYKAIIDCEACWVKIYDDSSLAWRCDSDHRRLTIYRAGEHGCIIQRRALEGQNE